MREKSFHIEISICHTRHRPFSTNTPLIGAASTRADTLVIGACTVTVGEGLLGLPWAGIGLGALALIINICVCHTQRSLFIDQHGRDERAARLTRARPQATTRTGQQRIGANMSTDHTWCRASQRVQQKELAASRKQAVPQSAVLSI